MQRPYRRALTITNTFTKTVKTMPGGTYPFADVIHTVGADNMGGLSVDVWFAPVTAIKTFLTYTDDSSIEMTGKIELKDAAQKIIHITASYKSAGVKSSPVGDIDGRCSKIEAEFFHPGASEAAAKFARAVQNTPGVFIMRDNEGRYRVIGEPVNPATVSVEHDTGKSPEDRRGFTFKIETYSTRPISYIKLDPPKKHPEWLPM